MANFVVAYDLIRNKDYKRIIDEMERLGGFRPLLSTWFVDLANSATEVRDHLSGFVDEDDKLIVVEFSKRPAFIKANQGTNAWIDAHF